MNNDYRILRRACGLAAVAAALLAEPARGAVTGPYTVDANTLQLWHLNEGAAATSAANAVGGGLTMQGVLNGATLGNGSFAGFGTSLDVSAGSDSLVSNDNPRVIMPPHRAILAGAPALSILNGGTDPVDDALDDVSLTYADPTTGAFTFEMIVKFNSAYDPLQPFRNVGPLDPPSNPGSYSMELLTGEGDLDPSTRPFQFRLNQVGITSAGDATNPKLEFHNIALQTGAPFFGVIPLTGEHAINNTDWFHVAVAYNGNDFEADNIKFYWTKLAASVTQANQLATIDGTGAAPTTWATDLAAIAHDFAIGNESRNNGTGFGEGENFYGQIDEVRISGVARTASEFVFGPGGPTEDADFDEDGDVDGQDFLRWQRGLGLTGAAATLANGNANGDAAINGLDLAVWKAQFGVGGATGAAGAAPEPACIALMAMSAVAAMRMRRKDAN
jgi:hypothetical protein